MTLTARQKAARKGARTRAANAASRKRYLEVDRPARMRTVALANRLLKYEVINLRFLGGVNRKLKGGAQYGELIRIIDPQTWLVKPEGYKHASIWHAGFWEVLV